MVFYQLRSYDNYIVANLQLQLLQVNGISCYLQDEHTITIDPLLSPAIGGMKLMVRESDAEKASHLLDETDADYVQTLACPACQKPALEKITMVNHPDGYWPRLKNKLLFGAEVTLSTYYRCNNCQQQFSSLPD